MAIATLTPPPSMSSSLDKIPVWLDCDVGHDDAMAIILAAYHPNINLLGISSVAGYSTIKHTTDNAIRVLEIAGIKGVKVHKGAHKPLIKKRVDSSIFHGRTGMARVSNLPDPDYESYFVEDVTAIEAMRKAIMESPVSVSIVATGPLTNIALLVSVYREVIPRIKTLSIMGGAIGFGDFTPAAEFNFFCDPDAAQMVFQSGIENIVLIPLEVTNTVLSTKAVLKRIQDGIAVSKFSTFATEVLRVFGDTFSYIHDEKDGYPLQDPVAVAYLVMPHAFVKKHIHVSVECSPGDGNGRSYCDLFNRLKRTSNCWIATSVDVDLFWNEMTDALVKASTNSPWADSLYNI